MFVGAYVGGAIVDRYPPAITVKTTVTAAAEEKPEAKALPLPNWDREGKTGLAQELGLKADSLLDPDQLPEQLVETDAKTGGGRSYARDDLAAAVRKADLNGDGKVSRVEWRLAQRKDWFHIWLWPAIAALVTCGLFWVGFRSPPMAARQPASA